MRGKGTHIKQAPQRDQICATSSSLILDNAESTNRRKLILNQIKTLTRLTHLKINNNIKLKRNIFF